MFARSRLAQSATLVTRSITSSATQSARATWLKDPSTKYL